MKDFSSLLNFPGVLRKTHDAGEVIALEGEVCDFIGVILEGEVEVKRVTSSGREYTLTVLTKGETFGEAIVFSSANVFPATIIARTKTTILHVPKSTVVKLCRENEEFLQDFLRILSDRILLLNKRLKESVLTLRQKICGFLIEEYKKQRDLRIRLPFPKKKLAEILNVERPSLSRELRKMREEGLVDFDREVIVIKDLSRLEEIASGFM